MQMINDRLVSKPLTSKSRHQVSPGKQTPCHSVQRQKTCVGEFSYLSYFKQITLRLWNIPQLNGSSSTWGVSSKRVILVSKMSYIDFLTGVSWGSFTLLRATVCLVAYLKGQHCLGMFGILLSQPQSLVTFFRSKLIFCGKSWGDS